jgi:hypothetical protein
MEVICPTFVVEMFSGTMWRGVLACGDVLRGTLKCQTLGRPAERAAQSTASFSQSTLPRWSVGAEGDAGSAARRGTDSCHRVSVFGVPERKSDTTYIPDQIDGPAAAEAAFVAAGEVDHPFFLTVELGRQLALEIADVDALDFLAGVEGVGDVGGDEFFDAVESVFEVVEEALVGWVVVGQREGEEGKKEGEGWETHGGVCEGATEKGRVELVQSRQLGSSREWSKVVMMEYSRCGCWRSSCGVTFN